MDREISVQELQKRKKNRIIRIATALAVLMLLFLLLPRWLEGKIPIENMPIGTVDKGPIEISIAATGKLVPLSEEIIVSPVGSRILEVYKNPGDTVHEGEPLLKLDLASVETEYRQKIDEKEMMKSKEIQAVITLENALAALRMDQQVKEMQMKQLWSDLQGEKYLDSIGASTPDKVRRAELNYAEAKLNLEQLEQKIINEQKNMTAGIRAQQLELSMFDKTLEEKARQLKNAQILAPQTATLTFIQNQIGMQVSAGDQLAIVSDRRTPGQTLPGEPGGHHRRKGQPARNHLFDHPLHYRRSNHIHRRPGRLFQSEPAQRPENRRICPLRQQNGGHAHPGVHTAEILRPGHLRNLGGQREQGRQKKSQTGRKRLRLHRGSRRALPRRKDHHVRYGAL